MKISTGDLGRHSPDELLAAVSQSDQLDLEVKQAFPHDPRNILQLIAGLHKLNPALAIRIPSSLSATLEAALEQSLLGPALWGTQQPTPLRGRARDLLRNTNNPSTIKRHTFLTATSDMRCDHQDNFAEDFLRFANTSQLDIPSRIVAALITIGFEIASNAEEYGYVLSVNSPEPSYRAFTVIRHPSHSPPATHFAEYLKRYKASGQDNAGDWFEMIVVDNGVGLTWPSYKLLAEAAHWSNTDVFRADLEVEKLRLRVLLADKESTKGRWGRVVNVSTLAGMGTRYVRFRLASLCGAAYVRTGRSRATWSFTNREPKPGEWDIPFEVEEAELPLFRGTLWHALVPSDSQLSLAL